MAKAKVPTGRLTARGGQILEALDAFIREHQYPPTVREIQSIIGLASSSTVYVHLYGLHRGGYLNWQPESPRTFVITDAGKKALRDRHVR
jgi:repressor LexA